MSSLDSDSAELTLPPPAVTPLEIVASVDTMPPEDITISFLVRLIQILFLAASYFRRQFLSMRQDLSTGSYFYV
jgi:hypothetical protein